jgi:anti-anti-sigma factor
MSEPTIHEAAEAAPAQLLRLDGEMSIYRAAELKPVMMGALGSAAPASTVTFDLSEVTEIDTSGVQLLLLARREAAAAGLSLTLAAASPAVVSAFELLELDDQLGVA